MHSSLILKYFTNRVLPIFIISTHFVNKDTWKGKHSFLLMHDEIQIGPNIVRATKSIIYVQLI